MGQLARSTTSRAMRTGAVESARAVEPSASMSAAASSLVVNGDAVGKKRMRPIGLQIVYLRASVNAFEPNDYLRRQTVSVKRKNWFADFQGFQRAKRAL